MQSISFTQQLSSLTKGRRYECAFIGVLSLLLLVAIAALMFRSCLISPINYNEGWNAYYTAFVLQGRPLYYPAGASLTNNYPPLSFFIIAPLARLIGDAILAGRLVAWIAFFADIIAIMAILQRITGDRISALFGGLIFAGYMVVNYDIYVGMNDPQMLAHAFMLCGLYAYVRRPEARWSSVVSAFLMCCGLFTKHNILALPIAFTLWLALFDRAACWRFVAAGVIFSSVATLACLAAFGTDFVADLRLGMVREFIPIRLWRHAIEWTYPMQVPLAFAAVAYAMDRRNRFTVLCALYIVIGIAVGFAAAGGLGTNFNLLFDVVIAFSLAGGHFVACLETLNGGLLRSLRPWIIGAYGVSAALGAGLIGTKDELMVWPWVGQQLKQEADFRDEVRLVADHAGPALCETIALCYWAHKEFELDPLNFTFGVHAGKKDESEIVRRVDAGYYSIIEVRDTGESFVPAPIVAAIKRDYKKIAAPRATYVRR